MNEDTANKIFDAVQTLRDELPALVTLVAALDPPAVPVLLAGQAVLTQIFEAVVRLRSMHDAESAKPALASATVAAAQAQLLAK